MMQCKCLGQPYACSRAEILKGNTDNTFPVACKNKNVCLHEEFSVGYGAPSYKSFISLIWS